MEQVDLHFNQLSKLISNVGLKNKGEKKSLRRNVIKISQNYIRYSLYQALYVFAYIYVLPEIRRKCLNIIIMHKTGCVNFY